MACHRSLSLPFQRLSGYSLLDLDQGEQLLVWASRRWLARQNQWPAVEMEYALSLGQKTGLSALAALERLLGLLRHYAKRTLFLNRSSSGQLSSDEVRLLSLLALAQGKAENLEFSWRFLVHEPHSQAAARECRLLADCFSSAQMDFVLRCMQPHPKTQDTAEVKTTPFLIAGLG